MTLILVHSLSTWSHYKKCCLDRRKPEWDQIKLLSDDYHALAETKPLIMFREIRIWFEIKIFKRSNKERVNTNDDFITGG